MINWRECYLKKKYGRLGLVDPEQAKTSLLCKWIVRAMEPGESNLQLMLRFRLSHFKSQRGRSWGPSLDWFTNKQHQGFSGSKVWGHISNAWKTMVKGLYQLPPRMELLHSNLWWSEGVDLLKNGFTYTQWINLYRKCIKCVDDIWNSGEQDFLITEQARKKFQLTPTEEGEWDMVVNKVSDKWRDLLESDADTTHPGHWLGFYATGKDEPAFVFQCVNTFALLCCQWHNITLPFPVQCFTVGTHSRCLREGEDKPTCTLVLFWMNAVDVTVQFSCTSQPKWS